MAGLRAQGDAPVIACVEVGGSGIQTAIFEAETPRFVDSVAVPTDAVVGVAVPGFVAEGLVVRSSVFEGAHVDPVEHLGIDAVIRLVCNDAEAAAVGEWVLRDRHDDALVYVGLGSGVGGAVAIEGHATVTNLFGHQPGFGLARCTCGAIGCLETVAAGWALPDRLGRSELHAAARAIGRAIREEQQAHRGVVVVGGGIARRHPAVVDLVAAELPDRQVVGSSAPTRAKSAAAFGLREMIERGDVPIDGGVGVADAAVCDGAG